VHPDEIKLAIQHVVEVALSIQREIVPAEVAQLLGVQRLSSEIADRIRAVVDDLVQEGLIHVHGPNLSLD
jgi:hypothetical protein